jgi:hypothetical protein
VKLHGEYGAVEHEAWRDIWKILIDEAEPEVHDKISDDSPRRRTPSVRSLAPVAHRCIRAWPCRTGKEIDASKPTEERRSACGDCRGVADKLRRLEAHGEEYKFAPLYKINPLRMLITGKANEYFDLREADRDRTNAAKAYEDLVNKAKDCSRRRKLDSTAQEKTQHGGDSLDVGAVGTWSWW